jgi:hypothetical protein
VGLVWLQYVFEKIVAAEYRNSKYIIHTVYNFINYLLKKLQRIIEKNMKAEYFHEENS